MLFYKSEVQQRLHDIRTLTMTM